MWRRSLLLLLVLGHSAADNRGIPNADVIDNGCKGYLDSPCVCDKVSVECINGQFTDTDLFLQVGIHFEYLESATFHGNSFNQLPKALFGPGMKHLRLKSLNLSANYIINLDGESFVGVPDLETLDLSYNEIVLKPGSEKLLSQVPKLRRLLLRKGFTRPRLSSKNDTLTKLNKLKSIFKHAPPRQLEELDLSWNFLKTIPPDLACSLPALARLNLAQNLLATLKLDPHCLGNLSSIDLSRNDFHRLDYTFRITSNSLPKYSLLLFRNNFKCDCHSNAYITWLRSSFKIKDRQELRCDFASPSKFKEALLMKVPLGELDCSVTSGVSTPFPSLFLLFVLPSQRLLL